MSEVQRVVQVSVQGGLAGMPGSVFLLGPAVVLHGPRLCYYVIIIVLVPINVPMWQHHAHMHQEP